MYASMMLVINLINMFFFNFLNLLFSIIYDRTEIWTMTLDTPNYTDFSEILELCLNKLGFLLMTVLYRPLIGGPALLGSAFVGLG